MATVEKKTVKLTKPAMMTFSMSLLEAKAIGPKGKEQGTPKHSANFEIDPAISAEDKAALTAEAVRVAREKWPGRDLKELQFPFKSGDALADKAKKASKDREFSRGKWVIVARSKFLPRLSYVEGGQIIEVDGENPEAVSRVKGKFYAGVQALAEFTFQAYEGVGNNPDGVTAYLNKVCSLNRGKKLSTGGGASSAETFKDYIGTESDYDPTAGLDDEIPL